MKTTPGKARFLHASIDQWLREGVLNDEQGQRLHQSIQIGIFDWQRLARYSFWFAISSLIIAVSALLGDRWLMDWLERLFDAPEAVKLIGAALATTLIFAYGLRRRRLLPGKIFSNEAIFFMGVLSTAGTIMLLGHIIDDDSGHFSLLILLAALIYGLLALWFPSRMIWFFAVLSLGSWLGAETGYVSGWGAYYLGMNYPLRFVLFGLLLIAAARLFHYWPSRREFANTTLSLGLLYFFIALWMMSIFGNYGDLEQWRRASQFELLEWSVAFTLAALVAIYHGIRYDNAMTRSFGLTFLFINLYTRYFEYFWNMTHKAIFFAVLALSFWYLGNHAEKLWNLGQEDSH